MGGGVRACKVRPRGTGPGLRPSSRHRAFSVWAICRSRAGIWALAVSYWDWAWATAISDTCPYLNWSWNRRSDSP